MAKVLVVHPFLDVKGGAEIPALKLAKYTLLAGAIVSRLSIPWRGYTGGC